MTCVNRGEKGHHAGQCSKPQVSLDQRPCFICKKTGCKSATCPMKKAQARLADSSTPIFGQQQQEQQPHGMSNVSAAANAQAQTVSSNPLYNFTVSAEDVPMRAVAKPFDVVYDATGKLITKGGFVKNRQKQSTQYEDLILFQPYSW